MGDLVEQRRPRGRGPDVGRRRNAAFEAVADGERHPAAQATGRVAKSEADEPRAPRERRRRGPPIREVETVPGRQELRHGV